MYTNLNKAIVAALVGVAALLGLFVPAIAKYADPTTIASVVAVVTPLLVYLIPNLPKDPA